MAGKLDAIQKLFKMMKSAGNVSWESKSIEKIVNKITKGQLREPNEYFQALANSISPTGIGSTTKQTIGKFYQKKIEEKIALENKEKISSILTPSEMQRAINGNEETLEKIINSKYEKLYNKILHTNREMANELLIDSEKNITLQDVQALSVDQFENLALDNKVEVLNSLQEKWKEDFSTKGRRREYVNKYARYIEDGSEGYTRWDTLEDDEKLEIAEFLAEKYGKKGAKNQQEAQRKWIVSDTEKDTYDANWVVKDYIEKKKEKRLEEKIRKNKITALTKKNWKTTTKMVSNKIAKSTTQVARKKKSSKITRAADAKAAKAFKNSKTWKKDNAIKAVKRKK